MIASHAALGAAGRFCILILIGGFGLLPQFSTAKVKPQEELEELRGRIENLQKELSEKEESRAEAADALRESEKNISDINRRLHELNALQSVEQSEVVALDKQIQVLERRTTREKQRIAKILRYRYMQGAQDTLKMVLSSQDPEHAVRQLYYYGYISRAQVEMVRQVKADSAELVELKRESEEKADEVGRLKEQEMHGKQQLETDRAKRKQLLVQLSTQISGQRREINRLKQNEQQLTRLIEEINRMLAKKRADETKKRMEAEAESKARKKLDKKPVHKDFNEEVPDDSLAGKAFASLKGKLKLPVRGELTNRFGSPREAGGVLWKGLLIRADGGQMVRTVADGRVVFADWLRGFGNLLIVNHGGGYMTLYGYNESLLRGVGDFIKSGENIAVVGNTGGNLDSGLYFEIRYQSKPLDPLSWVAR